MSTPHRSKERTLSASAAEKIVIEDTVCDGQQQGLAAQASTLSGAVGPASASLGSAAFGVMNGLLVGPMNSLASRTGELASTASAFASRMSEGVGAARATFAEVEEAAVAAFDGTEVGE